MARHGKSLGGLNIHRGRAGTKPGSFRKPVTDLDVEDALRARFLTADLAAPRHPRAVADAEYERIAGLASDIAAGRISIREARAQLRGAA